MVSQIISEYPYVQYMCRCMPEYTPKMKVILGPKDDTSDSGFQVPIWGLPVGWMTGREQVCDGPWDGGYVRVCDM